MTYFLEFHTPIGVFTSKPVDEGDKELAAIHFRGCKDDGNVRAVFEIPSSAGAFILTTQVARNSVLVIREAE